MKKLSFLVVLLTLFASPAWAGGPKKPQGSGPKTPALQKLPGLNLGGRGSQSSPSVQNAKPFKLPGITAQNLVPNQHHKPFQSQGITSQNLVSNQNPKPFKPQGITAQNLVPNRPLKPLKGSESVHNTLPVLASNPLPSKPGYVWTGSHWQRAPATAGSNGTYNPLPVPTYENFTTMANNPPPVTLSPVQDPPKPGRPMAGRPQHGNSANGGVTVNWRPGSQRPADVVGTGGSPIDYFFGAVGGAIGSDFEPGKLTRPTVVDHR